MSNKTLSELAHRLRNGAPDIFDAFVNEFSTYTDQAMMIMMNASTAEVLVRQGEVRQCVSLLRMLKECHIERKPPTPR